MNSIQKVADELYPTVAQRERFWQWPKLKPFAFGLSKLAPAMLLYGLWLANQLGVWLAHEQNQDQTQWFILAGVYLVLLLWGLLMLRASLTVHTLRWSWLALAAFVLPALLVAFLPSAWMAVLALLLLWGGFTLYHLPRSWAELQAQWHGNDTFSPKTKAMILSVMHHFEAMANQGHPHFPAMAEGLLTQVHEVEQD